MLFSKKMITLSATTIVAVSMATLAQQPSASNRQTIEVPGSINWVVQSSVSALKEGVIKQIEFQEGRIVQKDEPIGYLHDETAVLTEAKAKLAAENTGEIAKAGAQRDLASSELAKLISLAKKGPGFVSDSEMSKAKAEMNMADAARQVALETKRLYEAEYSLAKRAVEEHVIRAPFTGVITDKMKNAGESVRSNEPVVRIGGTDKLRFVGRVPLEVALRLKGNEPVEVRATIDDAELDIEKVVYKGKITAVGHEVLTNVGTTQVLVIAEIPVPLDPEHPELLLRPGTNGMMTVFLNNAPSKVASKR